jgi:hypothetical protein
MTLLLNLIGPDGIHQSSDYRLTNISTRQSVEDELGSKQVQFLAKAWSAQVSFTGIASVGSRKTRDWVLETLGRSETVDARTAVASLAETAAVELRAVAPKDWFLTIVATVIEKGHNARVFVVSCIDRPGQAPLSQPLDHFEVTEVLANAPTELIFGYTQAVRPADRRFLKNLNRRGTDEGAVRRALARVNSRSAKRSNGAISEGCLVSSTLLNGNSSSENFGGTPGAPVDVVGSTEMLEMLKKTQGPRPVMVQGRSGRFENVREASLGPMDVTEGSTLIVKTKADSPPLFVTDSSGNTFRHARAMNIDLDAEWAKLEEGKQAGASHRIEFSSTSGSYMFNGPKGPSQAYGLVEFLGVAGDAVVTKNRVTKIVLGRFKVQAYPAFEHHSVPVRTTWNISSGLNVNGAEPHSWGYTVEMVIDPTGASISVHENSVAFRSAGTAAVSCLQDTEELVLSSATRPFKMVISKESPSATALLETRMLVRDIIPSLSGRESQLRRR